VSRLEGVKDVCLFFAAWWSIEFIAIFAVAPGVNGISAGVAIILAAALSSMTVGVLVFWAQMSRLQSRQRDRP